MLDRDWETNKQRYNKSKDWIKRQVESLFKEKQKLPKKEPSTAKEQRWYEKLWKEWDAKADALNERIIKKITGK